MLRVVNLERLRYFNALGLQRPVSQFVARWRLICGPLFVQRDEESSILNPYGGYRLFVFAKPAVNSRLAARQECPRGVSSTMNTLGLWP
jgi:hypothetical protein